MSSSSPNSHILLFLHHISYIFQKKERELLPWHEFYGEHSVIGKWSSFRNNNKGGFIFTCDAWESKSWRIPSFSNKCIFFSFFNGIEINKCEYIYILNLFVCKLDFCSNNTLFENFNFYN